MRKISNTRFSMAGIWCLAVVILFTGCTTLSKHARKKDETDILTQSINHFERGLALEQDGKADAAVVEYKQSIELSPRPIVYYHLGLIYAAKADYATAIAHFDKAIALVPTYEEAIKERDRIKNAMH
ncbi:MAG: tetratricopeptide repeat protein [bacterium]